MYWILEKNEEKAQTLDTGFSELWRKKEKHLDEIISLWTYLEGKKIAITLLIKIYKLKKGESILNLYVFIKVEKPEYKNSTDFV